MKNTSKLAACDSAILEHYGRLMVNKLTSQADELVRRVKLHAHELEDKWLMATMAIGTEEVCLD